MTLKRALNVEDVRKRAARKLPKAVFSVIEGGVGDDITLRANRQSFEDLRLRPRVLVDIPPVDMRTNVLGSEISMPLMLAPCSFPRICHPSGERAIARAAGRAGTIYTVAGGAGEPVERIAEVAEGPLWYQLYVSRDDAANRDRVEQVRKAGYRVLCVNIDTPGKPFREADARNGFSLPLKITPNLAMRSATRPLWLAKFAAKHPEAGLSLTAAHRAYGGFVRALGASRRVTRKDIEELREMWDGPLVLKGVLRAEDIEDMVSLGVDGVIVSNHGGRNLDGAVASIDVLAEIVGAAAGRMEVYLDSGVRRGTDVVKALSLGATAVMIGRPYLYGLAAKGQKGVEHVLQLMSKEIEQAMTFVGAANTSDLHPDLVR